MWQTIVVPCINICALIFFKGVIGGGENFFSVEWPLFELQHCCMFQRASVVFEKKEKNEFFRKFLHVASAQREVMKKLAQFFSAV